MVMVLTVADTLAELLVAVCPEEIWRGVWFPMVVRGTWVGLVSTL